MMYQYSVWRVCMIFVILIIIRFSAFFDFFLE